VVEDLHLNPFSKPNRLLQGPIRNVLDEFDPPTIQECTGRGEVPVPDINGWMGECGKEIRGSNFMYFQGDSKSERARISTAAYIDRLVIVPEIPCRRSLGAIRNMPAHQAHMVYPRKLLSDYRLCPLEALLIAYNLQSPSETYDMRDMQ